MAVIETAPPTIHRSEEDLPFVDLGDGVELQVLQVDLAQGVWIIRNRFAPGVTVQRHKHTGAVYAFTESGCWYYLESPEAQNRAGSYLFEPAGSTHTLHVPDDVDETTSVSFVIYGANLNLAADDSVELVIDAQLVVDMYRAVCAEQHGIADPPVIVLDS